MISFIDFLKKYSSIPNKFLDDFFKLFDYHDVDYNEKIVNLDDVTKWLNVTKHAVKKTLETSYVKNEDYTIKKAYKPHGTGGQKREIIMLTIRCFKRICQMTRSKRGNAVRTYFIEVEEFLNKYKNYAENVHC